MDGTRVRYFPEAPSDKNRNPQIPGAVSLGLIASLKRLEQLDLTVMQLRRDMCRANHDKPRIWLKSKVHSKSSVNDMQIQFIRQIIVLD
jgi:hypothetical protein